MSSAIKVEVFQSNEWSYIHATKFDVIVKMSPDFMREPEFSISDDEKIEHVAQRVKEEFIKACKLKLEQNA